MSRLHVVGDAARWDPRRNTSMQQPVPPDALPNALRALARLRQAEPELVAWIERGAPHLTEAEHLERFGEPYVSKRPRR